MLLSEVHVDSPELLTFSGDDVTNSVVFWMQQLKKMAEEKHLTPEQMLALAKIKLAGSARTWFSYQKNVNTWDRFEELILAEFKSKTSKARIQEIMENKKRLPQESIMKYIHEIRLLGYRAQMEDSDIMEVIIKGATEDKYLRAILRTTTSFKTLQKVVEGFEEDSKSTNLFAPLRIKTGNRVIPYSRTMPSTFTYPTQNVGTMPKFTYPTQNPGYSVPFGCYFGNNGFGQQ